MNLKKRLVISNAAIVILPLFITIVASFLFVFIYSKVSDGDMRYEDIKKVSQIKYDMLKIHNQLLKEEGNKFNEKDFRKYIDNELQVVNIDAAIVKDEKVIFYTKKISKIDLEKCLEISKDSLSDGQIIINSTRYLLDVVPLNFADTKKGYAILLAPIGKSIDVLKNFIIFIVSVFIISFLVVNIFLSKALSRSILNPVNRLKRAAGELSDGNLDCTIIEDGDNEIKELCRAFEQMRIKLKEAVFIQKKYDDNRKMIVSSVSHDIKTPITSIKGYVEGIKDGVANTKEKVDEYLDTIHLKAEHVDMLIDDLLFYSKLDVNQIKFEYEKTDIRQYFLDCILECEYELIRSNISIKLQCEFNKSSEENNEIYEKKYVMIDRERMRRVIINIIDNSRKYMQRENGEIIISLREVGSSIVTELHDNGAGIDKEDLPYVFDKFYRSDQARNPKEGSGLGLAIAKQIVEGHGGRIWAVSNKNQGTSIMISLRKEVDGGKLE